MTIEVNGFGTPKGQFSPSILKDIIDTFDGVLEEYSAYTADSDQVTYDYNTMENGLFAEVGYSDLEYRIELNAQVVDNSDQIVYTILLYPIHDRCNELNAVCNTLPEALDRLIEATTMAFENCITWMG